MKPNPSNKIKQIFCQTIVAAMIVLGTGSSSAQDLDISGIAGLRFGGSLSGSQTTDGEVSLSDFRFDGGVNYGLILDLRMSDQIDLELAYDRMSTEFIRKDPQTGNESTVFFLNVDYLQFGLLYKFSKPENTTRPFVGLTGGGTFLGPEDRSDGAVRFSFAPLAGVKTFFSEQIGARIQARLVLTHFPESDELFCRDNQCLNQDGAALMSQFDFTVGLIIRL